MLVKSWPVLLGTLLVLNACAASPPPEQTAPASAACQNPVYVDLSTQHPDSLSDRAWERLQRLSAECSAEQAEAERVARRSGGHHHAAWLLMPGTMLFGGMMWLMMGL